MRKALMLGMILTSFNLYADAQIKNKLPFVGKKYFENKAYSTTYVVTIKPDGTTNIIAGGPGANNKGWIVYKGKYKPVMKNKEEGIKVKNGLLYLLNENGEIKKDCLDSNDNECECKYSIKTETLTR